MEGGDNMARKGTKTKNSVRLSVNLPKDLANAFDQYAENLGQSKTTALERILRDKLKVETKAAQNLSTH